MSLDMKKHLTGKCVLVTRRREQAASMIELLAGQGAQVLLAPLIEIKPVADLAALPQALSKLAPDDYLLVTSSNTANILTSVSTKPNKIQIVSVGEETAKILQESNWPVALVPHHHRAEGVLEILTAEKVKGRRILFPRAAAAKPELAAGLRARGAIVEEIVLYETLAPTQQQLAPLQKALAENKIDVFTFASSSAVENYAQLCGAVGVQIAAQKIVAALGPVTAQTCQKFGLPVQIMPKQATAAQFAAAIVDYFKKREGE